MRPSFWFEICVAANFLASGFGFLGSNSCTTTRQSRHVPRITSDVGNKFHDSLALSMDFGKFFSDAFNMTRGNGPPLNEENEDYITDDEEEYGYLGCENIFKIKVKSLKVGGCRLYLSLYLIGEANNPERGTWRMDQNGDGGIDLYHKDTTGALMILFKEDEIIVNRMGSAPSMNYLMSESTILNGMLDQLDDIAFDESINEEDRLICLCKPGNAINDVRESLSFN